MAQLVLHCSTLLILLVLTGKSFGASRYSGRGRTEAEGSDDGPHKLTPLISHQSCYYEAYSRRLACVCKSMDMEASLDLNLGYFALNSGNEIREVQLRQCRRLSIRLDFTGVDSSNFPIHFQSIEQLDIQYINFEPYYQDRQELELHFYNVQLLNFVGIYVMNTLKLKAVNVKEARFHNSTFAHIPVGGFEVSRTKFLSIRDSIFLRVSPKSITVEKTKEVSVAYNEMTINALEVVHATDGSHLFISCNRILQRPISPECSKITTSPRPTTTEPTTTTTTTQPPVLNLGADGALGSSRAVEDEKRAGSISGELIGGIIAGILLIVAILLIILLTRNRQLKQTPSRSANLHSVATETMASLDEGGFGGGSVEPPPPPALPSVAVTDPAALAASKSRLRPLADSADTAGPKFSSPIWMEEIQKNKIFSRQRQLLAEEKLQGWPAESQMATTAHLLPEMPEPPAGFREECNSSGDEGRRENSRTESDEDNEHHHRHHRHQHQPEVVTVGFHKHHHFQLETQI